MKLTLLVASAFAQCDLVRIAYQEMGGRQTVPSRCCSFQGITCNPQGQVTEINWNNQLLSGSISTALANLPYLESLDLSENQLTGPIPSELEFLSTLKTLDLRKNRLEGVVPFELTLLSNLEVLVLSNNQLYGEIPYGFGNLPQLKFLFLSANKLSGTIPDDIGNLFQLTILALDNNFLTGPIPESFGALPLSRLDLSNTRLSGPLVGEYPSLVSCSVSNTQLCRPPFGLVPRACNLPVCSPVPTGRPTTRTPFPTSTLPSITSRPTGRPTTAISSSTRPFPTQTSSSRPTITPGPGQCRYTISPLLPIPDLDGVVTARALFKRLLQRLSVSADIQRGTIVIPTDSSSIALNYEASLTTFEARNIILNNLINRFNEDYLFPSTASIDCTEPRGYVKVTLTIAGSARFANSVQ